MSSTLLLVNDFVSAKDEAAYMVSDPSLRSENLLEKVQLLLSEIRLMRAELAQAENNLAQTTSSLCEALYQDIELRQLGKMRDLSKINSRLTQDTAMVTQATVGA